MQLVTFYGWRNGDQDGWSNDGTITLRERTACRLNILHLRLNQRLKNTRVNQNTEELKRKVKSERSWRKEISRSGG